MLKKGIAVAALMAAASNVYAGGIEVAPAPAYFGGAFVQLGISRDAQNTSFRQTYITLANGQASDLSQSNLLNSGAFGWDGNLGVGYDYVWNRWSFGLEAYGDLSSDHEVMYDPTLIANQLTGTTTATTNFDLRMYGTFGISFLPGFYVAPGSEFFLDIGWVVSEFSLSGFPISDTAGNVNAVAAPPRRNVDQSGFRFGIGANTQLGPHLALSQEYDWETYDLIARTNVVPLGVLQAPTGGTFNNPVRVSPDLERYNLAAVYYFGRQGNAPDLDTAPAHVGMSFYAGINGSRDLVGSRATYWEDRQMNVNAAGFTTLDNITAAGGDSMISGFNIGAFGAWAWNFPNRWYTAVELGGNIDGANGRYSLAQPFNGGVLLGFNDYFRLTKQGDFSISFLPGYQVSDYALIYGRVGYVGARFSISNIMGGSPIVVAPALTPNQLNVLTFSRDVWLDGYQLGLGVDTFICSNLSLRTEFDVNSYNGIDTSAQLLAGNGFNMRAFSTRYHNIYEDSFNLGLIWHFYR